MQQHIDFPIEISVIQFQAWQIDKKTLFKIDSLNAQNTLVISLWHFLVVVCPDYHFAQSDLVGIGFLKA